MPLLQNHLDVNHNELQNAHLANLGSNPTVGASDQGLVWMNTTTDQFMGADGTATPVTLTNLLEGVTGTAPIVAGAITAKSQAISITAASGGAAGSMSASDFTKLGAATASNTVSTIVFRDGSGNFAAGTITASLTGTASNASALNSQTSAWHLDRANHSGTQLHTTISDFDAGVQTNRLDQMAVPTSTVSMNSQRISNVLDPSSAQDVATKAYVDALSVGLDVKASVRVASIATVTVTYNSTGGTSARGQLTAMPTTLDGVSLAASDRILLKDQSTGAQNGIWVVTTLGSGANGVWDRATDYDSDAEVTSGAFTFIEAGTNAATGWVLSTLNPITIGGASGTALVYTKFSDAGAYVAGAGMTLSGTTFNVIGTASRISVAADSIDIDSGYVGQASITTVGTIGTGTWNATLISVAKGGTGGTVAPAAGSVIYGVSTTAYGATAAGTSGQILTSGGASVPAWVTLVPIANGGTNSSATATAGGMGYGTGTAHAYTAAGTAGQIATSGGAGAPAWVTLLPIANGGTNSAATATAGGVGYGTGTAHAYTAAGTGGYILTSGGASAPAWVQTLPLANGGTNATTAAAARTSLVVPSMFTVLVGDGANGGAAANVTEVITHSLGTRSVTVSVFRDTTPWEEVWPTVEHTSTTTVTLRFSVAPAANAYRCVVTG